MKLNWITFVAARHNGLKHRGGSPSPVLAILGIAVGVLALIIIIAVMNGFQLGFIESILEISSYHIRAEVSNIEVLNAGSTASNAAGSQSEPLDALAAQEAEPDTDADADLQAAIAAIRQTPGVAAAMEFREMHAILRGRRTTQEGALIRGLPTDALEQDAGMASKLTFESGAFDLTDPRAILLGAELAYRLSARVGDSVNLVSVSGFFSSDDDETFTVKGIFRSGFYEYDLGWGFVNIDTAAKLDEGNPILGIKLKNRWQDSHVLSVIKALPACKDLNFVSWRTYNRAFFGALRSEKLLMFLLVGLIFIVVGLNIFQSQRRAVLERREEIGLLRALGANEWAVRLVFVWDGFVIGLAGAGTGLAFGLIIASHIPVFFTGLEHIVNAFIALANLIAGLFGASGMGEFAVFSPTIFYIKSIPSRVIPHEAALIFLFGFLSALLAAWFASGKAAKTRPADVLRYE